MSMRLSVNLSLWSPKSDQHQFSPNNNGYKKKISVQGKIKWKKIHAPQLTLKNIHAMALKKII